MEHFYESIEGWFTFQQLYQSMVNQATDNSLFIEVGTWKGRSAAFMAVEILKSGKKIKFDCIDPFIAVEGVPGFDITHEELKRTFIENMKPVEGHYTLYPEASPAPATYYKDKSVDFIFIDGSHTHEDVCADIMGWMPKMKIGGVISGHDYDELSCGVRSAVNQIFGDKNWSDGNGCWVIIVTEEIYNNICNLNISTAENS
jgi:hypothetical protein